MNECEHVIVVDVCCTIKRPTTMCLAKTKQTERIDGRLDDIRSDRTDGHLGTMTTALLGVQFFFK